jgi:bifunctional non-homologous end joining protein LigD
MSEADSTLRVGRRAVRFTHPDKVLFERGGHTKRDLAAYLERIAPVMLPHVRGRPVSMQVFPAGIERRGHFAKEAPGHFPAWIDRVTVSKHGGTVTHVVADDAPTLVYLAGQNVVTPHVWLSRADDPRRPDRLVIDLDPSREDFAEIRAAARELGDLYREVGLSPWAMVTGSRGVHVVAPLRRDATFEDSHAVARAIAEHWVAMHPDRLTLEALKKNRGDRLFVDTNRNAWAQTAVPPYAPRARAGAPVAMPLRWEELDDRALRPDGWTIDTAPARIEAEGDAWKGINRHARSLGRVQRALERWAPA